MQGDRAIILDMDGVLLQTQHLHAIAWQRTFDEFLASLGREKRFDIVEDYRKYLDGKPRYDGIQSYLNFLGVDLPLGTVNDPPGLGTVHALGMIKQKHYQDLLAERGPMVYQDSLDAVKRWTNQHVPLAVVSSSTACKAVLQLGRMEIFFDAIVDPQLASKQNLKGKPAPDYFIHGAELLGFKPHDCIVVEDSLAGVEAAKKGGFFKVYGMNHEGDKEKERELLNAGADQVIHSLNEITPEVIGVTEEQWTLGG